MPTATVTGPIRDQTGGFPMDATMEFRLRQAPRDTDTAIGRGLTLASVTNGAFSATLYCYPGIPIVYDALLHHRPFPGAEMICDDIGPVVLSAAGTFPISRLIPVKIPIDVTDQAEFKPGDTIEMAGVWMDEFGMPISHSGVTISAALLGPDDALRPMSVTKGSPAADGEFTVTMTAAASADLPLGRHLIDIKFATAGVVVRTLTSTISIKQRITP